MRAIQIKEYVKTPSDLTVTTLPNPTPSPTQYLIAVHASATNFFDLLQISGKYQHQPPLPWISGSEFAGVVLAVPSCFSPSPSPSSSSSSPSEDSASASASSASSSTPKFQPGDPVFGAAQGSYATLICATESQLRAVPHGWGFEDAAGLMITAPTAYAALVIRAGVKRGDWVLVHAAAGGVGLAAVQVAKALGAHVIATAGSEGKLDVVRKGGFGVEGGVVYSGKGKGKGKGGWEEEVRALTPGNRGVDVVFDPVGLVNASLKCVAWNGRIVVIGFAAGEIEKVAMNRVLLKNVSLVGLHWGLYAQEEPETVERVWEGLFELMESGKFKGTRFRDRQFTGLESVGEALGALGRRETWGKVVVKVPQLEGASKL